MAWLLDSYPSKQKSYSKALRRNDCKKSEKYGRFCETNGTQRLFVLLIRIPSVRQILGCGFEW